jgi:hypothetical protein
VSRIRGISGRPDLVDKMKQKRSLIPKKGPTPLAGSALFFSTRWLAGTLFRAIAGEPLRVNVAHNDFTGTGNRIAAVVQAPGRSARPGLIRFT